MVRRSTFMGVPRRFISASHSGSMTAGSSGSPHSISFSSTAMKPPGGFDPAAERWLSQFRSEWEDSSFNGRFMEPDMSASTIGLPNSVDRKGKRGLSRFDIY